MVDRYQGNWTLQFSNMTTGSAREQNLSIFVKVNNLQRNLVSTENRHQGKRLILPKIQWFSQRIQACFVNSGNHSNHPADEIKPLEKY